MDGGRVRPFSFEASYDQESESLIYVPRAWVALITLTLKTLFLVPLKIVTPQHFASSANEATHILHDPALPLSRLQVEQYRTKTGKSLLSLECALQSLWYDGTQPEEKFIVVGVKVEAKAEEDELPSRDDGAAARFVGKVKAEEIDHDESMEVQERDSPQG